MKQVKDFLFSTPEAFFITNRISLCRAVKGCAGGGTSVQSIQAGPGITVDSSDPQNPIISTSASGLASVQPGTGISVDNTDPANPIINNDGVLGIVAGTGITVDSTNPTLPIINASAISNIYTADGTTTNQTRTLTIQGGSGGSVIFQGDQMRNQFHNLQTEIRYGAGGTSVFTVNSSGISLVGAACTAPTMPVATNNTTIATTAFVYSVMFQSGATAARPSSPSTGQHFFDTTLIKPIWYNGTNWVDATGTTV